MTRRGREQLRHGGVGRDDRVMQADDRLRVVNTAMGVSVAHADERLEERPLLVGRSPMGSAIAGHGSMVPIRGRRVIGQGTERIVGQVTESHGVGGF